MFAMNPTPVQLRRLEEAARDAAKHAYAPYSGFTVGAAVLTEHGKIVTGANVENASYGLCNCAERTAIFTAISQGARALRCVVVYTPTKKPTAPCGACRQVISEFGPAVRIISVCDSDARVETTVADLLPGAFGPHNLAAKPRSVRSARERRR
jgi:cytidine deaminase, homotetrameric